MYQYEKLAKRLEIWIFRELSAGSRLPAERDLAANFTVSRDTLRRALALLEAKGIIERNHGSGTRVALGLSKANGKTVEVISELRIASLRESTIYTTLFRDLTRFLEAKGHRVLLSDKRDWNATGREADAFLTLGIDDEEILRTVYRTGKPMVSVDDPAHGLEIDAVALDHYGAGFKAASALYELGHRRIAFLGDRPYASKTRMGSASHAAFSGFMFRAEELKMAVAPIDSFEQSELERAGKWALDIVNHKPETTALITCSARHLRRIIEKLETAGHRVPQDVSLLCMSDWIGESAGDRQPANFISDFETMALEAVSLLENRLASGVMSHAKIMLMRQFHPGYTVAKVINPIKNEV